MAKLSPLYRHDRAEGEPPIGYAFVCPGCGIYHSLYVRQGQHRYEKGAVWSFDGNLERPTFSPSLLVRWEDGEQRERRRCHSFIKGGKIQFLNDCTHHLKGQTVELPEIEEA